MHHGTVAFYQSGFRYEADNRLKPGLVTHALVIQACLDRGLDVYDFLASEVAGSRYKQSLATDNAKLACPNAKLQRGSESQYLAVHCHFQLALARFDGQTFDAHGLKVLLHPQFSDDRAEDQPQQPQSAGCIGKVDAELPAI